MPKGLKIYLAMLLVLIGAQIVVAGENVVDFHRALDAYEQQREPNQAEPEEVKEEMKNPEIEVKVDKDED